MHKIDNYLVNLNIIREFKPEPIPVFVEIESTMLYIMWNLYDRISRGLKSFVVLCETECFYDAILVAGNVLETCSILSYIKDNRNLDFQNTNTEKYIARCAAGRLLSILTTSDFLEPIHVREAYASVLKIFYTVGHRIIKKSVLNGQKTKEKHEEIITQINYRLGNNLDKAKLIVENYNRPDPEGYVKSFSKRMKHLDDGMFEMSYRKYCDFKHINFMSPGTVSEDLDYDTINWFVDLLLGVVGYLQKYKLSPCIID